MSVLSNNVIAGASIAEEATGDFQITKSLRFNSADSTYLKSGRATKGNQRVFTWSGWVKRQKLGTRQVFLCPYSSNGENTFYFCFDDSDTDCIQVGDYTTTWQFELISDGVFRDTSAWYHVCLAVDTTQSIDVNRVKLWVNGVAQAWRSGSQPSQNHKTQMNKNVSHDIGKLAASSVYADWYLADVYFIDGLQLYPAAFAHLDSAGIWQPRSFAIQTPNNGTTWSNSVYTSNSTYNSSSTSTEFPSGGVDQPAEAFSGTDDTSGATEAGTAYSGGDLPAWIYFRPATPIENVETIRVFTRYSQVIRVNDVVTSVTQTGIYPAWVDIPKEYIPSDGKLTSIAFRSTTGNARFSGIEINGVRLIDGKTDSTTRNNPNNGTTWSSGTEAGTALGTDDDAENAFDGSLTTSNSMVSANSSTYSLTLPSSVTVKHRVRLHCHTQSASAYAKVYITPTGGSNTAYSTTGSFATATWKELFTGTGELTKIEVVSDGSNRAGIQAVEVDGHILVDSIYDNSFHLKFDETDDITKLGHDSFVTDAGSLYSACTDDDAANYPAAWGFDGVLTTNTNGPNSGGIYKFDFSPIGGIAYTNGVQCYINNTTNGQYDRTRVNNGAWTDWNTGGTGDQWEWVAVATGSGTMYTFEIEDSPNNSVSGAAEGSFRALRINGDTILTDRTGNNFIAKNFTTGATTVANATGGKPILGVNDSTFAYTSGYTTDSDSANLLLAVPMKDSGPGTDVHASIKGSGTNRTLTTLNATYATTPDAHFYGAAANLDINANTAIKTSTDADDFEFGTGDFTIEWWAKYPDAVSSNGYICSFQKDDYSGSPYPLYIYRGSNNDTHVWTSASVSDKTAWPSSPIGTWNHYALVRSGSGQTWTAYLDGAITETWTTDAYSMTTVDQLCIGGYEAGSLAADCLIQDFRVYNKAKYTAPFIVPSPVDSTSHDSFIDSPTSYGTDTGVGGELRGNYCVLNPLAVDGIDSITQGGLEAYESGDPFRSVFGSLGMHTGKWYFECQLTSIGGSNDPNCAGVGVIASSQTYRCNTYFSVDSAGYAYMAKNGETSNNDAIHNTGYTAWNNAGDVVGIAFDADNGKIYFSRNGTWQGSSNPATGANPAYTGLTKLPYLPALELALGAKAVMNFGQRPFKYAAPTDYKCLCVNNLDDTFSGDELNNPSKYFDVLTFTGTGNSTTNTETRLGFQPDLLWFKKRNGTMSHVMYDAIRGTSNALRADVTNSESAFGNAVVTGTSTGYTITGSNTGGLNDTSDNMVGWFWDAGTAAATPIDTGDITPSNVWKNRTAGFSITKYTGTGSDHSVPHDLGTKPDMFFVKRTNDTGSWRGWHDALSDGKSIDLDSSAAEFTDDSFTQEVDNNYVYLEGSVGNVNASGSTYMLYAWTAIPGYSAFGSYTGNDSSDGPFVYTGFRPRWIMIKNTTAGDSSYAKHWHIYDTVRNSFNEVNKALFANEGNGGYTYEGANDARPIDILSNGFKIRESDSNINTVITYLYAAFAEHPLKTARAK